MRVVAAFCGQALAGSDVGRREVMSGCFQLFSILKAAHMLTATSMNPQKSDQAFEYSARDLSRPASDVASLSMSDAFGKGENACIASSDPRAVQAMAALGEAHFDLS